MRAHFLPTHKNHPPRCPKYLWWPHWLPLVGVFEHDFNHPQTAFLFSTIHDVLNICDGHTGCHLWGCLNMISITPIKVMRGEIYLGHQGWVNEHVLVHPAGRILSRANELTTGGQKWTSTTREMHIYIHSSNIHAWLLLYGLLNNQPFALESLSVVIKLFALCCPVFDSSLLRSTETCATQTKRLNWQNILFYLTKLWILFMFLTMYCRCKWMWNQQWRLWSDLH